MHSARGPRESPLSDRLLLRVAAPLAFVGIAPASLRYLAPADLHVALTEPIFGTYATEQLAVLRQHPGYEHTHRLGGVAWMALGLVQLLPGLRARRPEIHRWLGRAFVLVSLVVGLGGAAMGMAHARARRIRAHRAWMIRCLGVGLGISVIRVFAVALTRTTDIPTTAIITPTFWAGWSGSVLAAELYLGRRPALSGSLGSTPRSAAPPPALPAASAPPGRAARTASR